MSSVESDDRGGEVYSAEEVGNTRIVSGGNCAELLQLGKETLDQLSGFLQVLIVLVLFRAV